jgi:hypothetical protein
MPESLLPPRRYKNSRKEDKLLKIKMRRLMSNSLLRWLRQRRISPMISL